MKTNVGKYDRIARLIVGSTLTLVGAAALLDVITIAAGTLGLALATLLFVGGLWLVATGLTRKSPVYRALGVDTSRRESDAESEHEPMDAETTDTGPGRVA